MRILIDTHVLIWCDQRPGLIVPALLDTLQEARNDVFVSAASVWEVVIKRALGKLVFPVSVVEATARLGFQLLPITALHAEYAGGLPPHHNDPFDRMLVAQAHLEQLVLGTQDRAIGRYGVATLGVN